MSEETYRLVGAICTMLTTGAIIGYVVYMVYEFKNKY